MAIQIHEVNLLLQQQPVPPSLEGAISGLKHVGLDEEELSFIIQKRRPYMANKLQKPGCENVVTDHALTIYLYTLDDPRVYEAINNAMFSTDRQGSDGKPSKQLRSCIPFIKYLDVALLNLPERFRFVGKVHRGVKWVFPSPTNHDPESYFRTGKIVQWFDFKSSSKVADTMYGDQFCGTKGPRTIFSISASQAYDISEFSFFGDDEAEVLFRPLSTFKVEAATKLNDPQCRKDPNGGFPDNVVLVQISGGLEYDAELKADVSGNSGSVKGASELQTWIEKYLGQLFDEAKRSALLDVLENNDVTLPILFTLDEEELKELGLSFGQLRAMRKALDDHRLAAGSDAARELEEQRKAEAAAEAAKQAAEAAAKKEAEQRAMQAAAAKAEKEAVETAKQAAELKAKQDAEAEMKRAAELKVARLQGEVDTLTAAKTHLEDSVQNLELQLEVLKGEAAIAATETNNLKQAKRKLEESLTPLHAQIESLRKEKLDLQGENDRLTNSAQAAAEGVMDTLRADAAAARAAAAADAAAGERARAEAARLREELAVAVRRADGAADAERGLTKRLETSLNDLAESNRARDAAMNKLAEIQRDMDAVTASRIKQDSLIDQLHHEIAQEAEISAAHTQELTHSRDEADQAVGRVRKSLEVLTAEKVKQDRIIDDLRRQMARTRGTAPLPGQPGSGGEGWVGGEYDGGAAGLQSAPTTPHMAPPPAHAFPAARPAAAAAAAAAEGPVDGAARPVGVGILVGRDGDSERAGAGVLVMDLVPGGPAAACGRIQPSDELLSVDSVAVTSLPFDHISRILCGPEGTPVTLEFRRGGPAQANRTFTVTLIRRTPAPPRR